MGADIVQAALIQVTAAVTAAKVTMGAAALRVEPQDTLEMVALTVARVRAAVVVAGLHQANKLVFVLVARVTLYPLLTIGVAAVVVAWVCLAKVQTAPEVLVKVVAGVVEVAEAPGLVAP